MIFELLEKNRYKKYYLNQLEIVRKKSIPFLDEFKSEAEELNFYIEKGQPSRQRYGDRWYSFLNHLAKSLLSLYKYVTVVVNYHPYYNDCYITSSDIKKVGGNNTNRKHIEKSLIQFYVDMAVSKAKHTFFTEAPQDSIKDLNNNRIYKIYSTGLKICDYLNEDEMQSSVAYLGYNIFLMYDFLYDKHTKNGVFSNFKTDYLVFQRSKRAFPYDEVIDLHSMRNSSLFIIRNVLKIQLNQNDYNMCSKLVQLVEQGQTNICLEPLSYYVGFKFWKMGKLAQLKFISPDGMFNNKLIKDNFPNYIRKQLELADNVYNGKISANKYFAQSYNSDLGIAENVIYKYFQPKATHLNCKDIELTTLPDVKLIPSIIETDIISLTKTIENAINIKDTNKNYCKFNRILFKSNKDEIINLIHGIFLSLKNTNKILVGLYKSGALIAHCINICDGNNKPVLLFTTYPFIGIYPRSICLNNYEKEFLLIDESYKTGFTSVIVKEHIERKTKNNIYEVFNVARFTSYSDVSKLPITSLAEVSTRGDLYTIKTENMLETKKSVNIEEYFKEIRNSSSKINLSELVINNSIITVNGNKEYDASRLLSDTNLLFLISYFFLKEIDNMSGSKSVVNVFIGSATDEGKLLSEAIALTSIILGYNYKYVFEMNEVHESTVLDLKIFVDLGIGSGTTLGVYSMAELNEPDPCNYFDLMFSVLSSKAAVDKFKNKNKYICLR
ncbi:MAG: hypothetical protein FD174_258 [Geobacteraceae bacterium]|nr:MAG: hypothetical protein FD174_258 [Geobacteraceae bacterium]